MNNQFFRIGFLLLKTNIFLSLLFLNRLVLCEQEKGGQQKKVMNILMVVPSFPKIHDICMLNHMTGLIDRGHNVTIYALSKGDFVNVQKDVITYDLINKTIFETLPANLDEYDIIMFQLGHKLFDVRATHHYKGKIVVCLRGYDITGFLQEHPHAYDYYFDKCDLFLPVCKAFKKLLEQEGCPSEKIIVHHSSIDLSKFTFQAASLPRKGTFNILSAGRFVEKKGFEYAIKAIARMVKQYPNIRYTLIGEGALKNKYKKLIKSLKMNNNIKIDGWHAHEEYIKILRNSHLFILPSVTADNNDQEGIPNVLKEAMAMGRLVTATVHSGNPELIEHKVSGILVPERDSDAIANAIEYFIVHPDKWKSIQLAAKNKIYKEFDKETENDKLEAILLTLLRGVA